MRVYYKLDGKLRIIAVGTNDHAEAIKEVKDQFITSGAVLALVKK